MAFTEKRFVPPVTTGYDSKDIRALAKAVVDYLQSLEDKGALKIDESYIRAPQGIVFPAGKSSSSSDTLDAYAETQTTPTPTPGTGAFTTVSATVNSQQMGNRVNFDATVVITTNGTAGTYVQLTLPFTAASITGIGGGRDDDIGLVGLVNGSTLFIFKYDGTYPGGSGRTLYVSGTVRV